MSYHHKDKHWGTGLPREDIEWFQRLREWQAKNGYPVTREEPWFSHQELNLRDVYQATIKVGGFDKVTDEKKWSTVVKNMRKPPKATNAPFYLKLQYWKFLRAWEAWDQRGEKLSVEAMMLPLPQPGLAAATSDAAKKAEQQGVDLAAAVPPANKTAIALAEQHERVSGIRGPVSAAAAAAAAAVPAFVPPGMRQHWQMAALRAHQQHGQPGQPPAPPHASAAMAAAAAAATAVRAPAQARVSSRIDLAGAGAPQDVAAASELPRPVFGPGEAYDIMNSLVLSLQSGLPNEMDWALNVLLHVSGSEHVTFSLVDYPNLLPAMLSAITLCETQLAAEPTYPLVQVPAVRHHRSRGAIADHVPDTQPARAAYRVQQPVLQDDAALDEQMIRRDYDDGNALFAPNTRVATRLASLAVVLANAAACRGSHPMLLRAPAVLLRLRLWLQQVVLVRGATIEAYLAAAKASVPVLRGGQLGAELQWVALDVIHHLAEYVRLSDSKWSYLPAMLFALVDGNPTLMPSAAASDAVISVLETLNKLYLSHESNIHYLLQLGQPFLSWLAHLLALDDVALVIEALQLLRSLSEADINEKLKVAATPHMLHSLVSLLELDDFSAVLSLLSVQVIASLAEAPGNRKRLLPFTERLLDVLIARGDIGGQMEEILSELA